MELNNAIIVLIAGLGPLCGVLLARIAPEELADGKSYFELGFAGISALVLAVGLFPLIGNWSLIPAVVLGGIVLRYPHDLRISFTVVAFVLVLALLSPIGAALKAVLGTGVFLLGLPAGTLVDYKRKQKGIFDSSKGFIPSLILNLLLALFL